MTAADLSPSMLTHLLRLEAGIQPDGRSWRGIQALQRRGLVELDGATWILTDEGAAALAESRRPATFHLEVRLGNAAMLESCDVSAVLLHLAGHVSADQGFEARDRAIYDENGNVVGSWGWGDAPR